MRKRRVTVILVAVVLVLVLLSCALIAVFQSADAPKPPKNNGEETQDSTSDDTKDTQSDSEQKTEPQTDKQTDPGTDSRTEPQTDPDTEPVTEPKTEPVSDPEPQTEPITDPTPDLHRTDVGAYENYRGGWLDIAAYGTKEALTKAGAALRAEGYTAVTVDLKAGGGMLGYASAYADAKTFGAVPKTAVLTVSEIVDALHDADLFVTGRFSVFRDDCFAKKNSAPDVLMNENGFRYSDGASRWASVFSKDKAWTYELALLAEIAGSGIDEVLLTDYALPGDNGTTAYISDETQNAAETAAAFVTEAAKKLPGITLSLAADADALLSGEKDGCNIEKLSHLCAGFSVDLTADALTDGRKIGAEVISDAKNDPGAAVKLVLDVLGTRQYPVRPMMSLTGNAGRDRGQKTAAETITGIYQMAE